MSTDVDGQGSRGGEPPRNIAEGNAMLRESEERFRALVESVSDWVWEVDENVAYTFASPKIRDLLGYEPEEVLGKTPFDLMPPDEALRVKEIFLSYSARREPFPAIENINLHKDGRPVVLETSGTPYFDGNGTFRGYRGIDREVGTRKRVEEELRKGEEHLLQVRKFEEIGHLAGGLAHHLNNLLTVVTGYSELLLTQVPEVDPRYGEILKIRAAGERAAELTRELLAFSRRQILRPRTVEVNRFLSERSATLRDVAGRSVRFTFSPGEDAGLIRVDPEPLHQALVHLVANARDAMPGGGELDIATAAACLTGQIEGIDVAPGWHTLLTVRDSGSGIDAETRTRIFQPFASLKTGSEGMGLPSIYGFVKQSGGYIFVDSRPGHGTTFRIYFPRLDRPEDLLPGDTRPLAGPPTAG
ncbi:MAG: two-component system sensor histidine kinase NtrB [Candidatus Deferrimicrobiaceae bacterium]